MAKYLLIEPRNPSESTEVFNDYELAASLARDGNDVTFFLVQNGVFPARREASRNGLQTLIVRGVVVVSDEFSLRERGIPRDALADGVASESLELVLDHLENGWRAIWL